MAKVNVVEFVSQVKQEVRKVTWSTQKELVASFVMVLISVLVASLFFVAIDAIAYKVIQLILGIK